MTDPKQLSEEEKTLVFTEAKRFDMESVFKDEEFNGLFEVVSSIAEKRYKAGLDRAVEAIKTMVKGGKDPYMFPLTEERFMRDLDGLRANIQAIRNKDETDTAHPGL